ncbi:hypothetical protein K458DRAFT_399656 [Lentithecium fluviatile CBS 122367]|uniref:Uncharacterized protein n=1 Tax=Lentithecium fluviatile CBS 122367 TaxID=1168545 RepID=A0A6G1JIM0_9PLEO|nr:hypothetical protein K458DRAFT_399656 [Lentithecium fluviatile CBS 122367]
MAPPTSYYPYSSLPLYGGPTAESSSVKQESHPQNTTASPTTSPTMPAPTSYCTWPGLPIYHKPTVQSTSDSSPPPYAAAISTTYPPTHPSAPARSPRIARALIPSRTNGRDRFPSPSPLSTYRPPPYISHGYSLSAYPPSNPVQPPPRPFLRPVRMEHDIDAFSLVDVEAAPETRQWLQQQTQGPGCLRRMAHHLRESILFRTVMLLGLSVIVLLVFAAVFRAGQRAREAAMERGE